MPSIRIDTEGFSNLPHPHREFVDTLGGALPRFCLCNLKWLKSEKRLAPLFVSDPRLEFVLFFDLLQQLENALRRGVGLRQHCGGRLHEDVVLGVGGHFLRHIEVADAALGGAEVL